MKMLQARYLFKYIVFTESLPIHQYCLQNHILSLNISSQNQYGLPYANRLLVETKSLFHSQFYGYLNSDILMNPRILPSLFFLSSRHFSSSVDVFVFHNG